MYDQEMNGQVDLDGIEDFLDLPDSHFGDASYSFYDENSAEFAHASSELQQSHEHSHSAGQQHSQHNEHRHHHHQSDGNSGPHVDHQDDNGTGPQFGRENSHNQGVYRGAGGGHHGDGHHGHQGQQQHGHEDHHMHHTGPGGVNPNELFHSPVVGPVSDHTPLLSPASVAEQRQFSGGEFAIPPSYFSPAMSPLIAPTDPSSIYLPSSLQAQAQRAQRRSVGNVVRVAKQSPSIRPRRRRPPGSAGGSTASLSSLAGAADTSSGGANASASAAASTHSNSEGNTPGAASSSDGISPTSLSQSVGTSPAQIKEEPHEEMSVMPPPLPAATPARLMNINVGDLHSSVPGGPRSGSSSDAYVEERLNMAIMATAAVPQGRQGSVPSASPSPSSTPGLTPRVGASGGPGGAGMDERRRFSSASQSSSSAITPNIRPRLARHGSRASSGTTSPAMVPHVSPAIVSPNMSPRHLLGGHTDGEVAALLASKSNYQNLMEGNHHQLGLQYPDRLTSDMSNKKASHKIAEQERRNRLNTAIVELGRLIDPDTTMTSKAATVEAAIHYIKALKLQVHELKDRLTQSPAKS